MILVDTSVWIEHLRAANPNLQGLLAEGRVRTHPFVIGELACGAMPRRGEVLALLGKLPTLDVVSHREAMHLLSASRLEGRGLGWVDVHLVASALVSGDAFWTLDLRLANAARALRVAEYRP